MGSFSELNFFIKLFISRESDLFKPSILLISIAPLLSTFIIGVVLFFFRTSSVKFEISPSISINSRVAKDHNSILFLSSILKLFTNT